MASVYRAWQLLNRNCDDAGSLRLGGKNLKAHTHIYSIPKGLVGDGIPYKQS